MDIVCCGPHRFDESNPLSEETKSVKCKVLRISVSDGVQKPISPNPTQAPNPRRSSVTRLEMWLGGSQFDAFGYVDSQRDHSWRTTNTTRHACLTFSSFLPTERILIEIWNLLYQMHNLHFYVFPTSEFFSPHSPMRYLNWISKNL